MAVVLGAGGLTIATAASAPSSFVSITPVRVLDTRTGVGLSGPFVSQAGRRLQLTGDIPTSDGPAVVVPTGATAVVLNVTAVLPSAAGFISVRPAGTTGPPSTSSLNFVAGAIVPNAVTVALAQGGAIDVVYDAFGAAGPSTDMLIDVMGYYTAAGAGAGPQGDQGPPGPRGVSAWETIPSGVTVSGYEVWDMEAPGPGGDFLFSVPFPARAPVPLGGSDVNFAAEEPPSSIVGDDDVACTGTTAVPTAPAGKVCLYRQGSLRATNMTGTANQVLADRGFTVRWQASPTAAANDDMYVRISWAYTAP